MRTSSRTAAAVVLAAAMFTTATMAIANPDLDGDAFSACLDKGKLKDVEVGSSEEPCKKGLRIRWNAEGIAGPVGPQGDPGELGPMGADGPQGPAGETGTQGPQGAVGPAGPTGAQGPSGAAASTLWFRDADGDGFGDWYDSISSALQPLGYVGNNDDCHDGNDAINPGIGADTGGAATFGAFGYTDADCDGVIGEDRLLTWYRDNDRDGFGDNTDFLVRRQGDGTVPGGGYVLNDLDCDDANTAMAPCGPRDFDFDGDGHDAIIAGGDDCDDRAANRYPGNIEIPDPDGVDEDCNFGTGGPVARFDENTADPRHASELQRYPQVFNFH